MPKIKNLELELDDPEPPRVFNYVDAMPGAGKTEYFVNLAEAHIKEKRNHILVYVAPTRQLLYETFWRLTQRDVSFQNVFMVTDNRNLVKAKDLPQFGTWLKDAPSVALNFLLGLVTDEGYQATKYKKGYAKQCTRRLQAGDILFTTHEAFLRVHLLDRTRQDFKILKRCHVVFDEARKCVISSDTLTLEAKDFAALVLCMEGRTVHHDSTCVVSEVTRVKDKDVIRYHFGVTRDSLIPAPVKRIKTLFDKYMKNGRASMYILSNSKYALGDFMSPTNKINVNLTLRPISLFQHYGKVTLVSAFLKDSQMYHFLKKDGHTFVDLLAEKLPKNHPLRAVQVRSKRLERNVAPRLEVAALLVPDVNLTSHRDNLTSHLLQQKLIVPKDFEGQASSEDEDDLSYIPLAYRAPPLWILLREAHTVFRKWQSTHTYAKETLVTVNAFSGTRTWRGLVRPLAVLKSIAVHGYLHKTSRYGEDDDGEEYMTSAESRDDSFTSIRWKKFFAATLHSRDKVLRIPKSPSLHGVNTYSKLFAFTHLAALNPTPDLIRLYRVLLGDYNIDLDHAIDNLVQMLYRTNLRDPDGKDPVLLIVPYYSMALALAEKIGVSAFKQVHTPKLMAMAHSSIGAKERYTSGVKKGGLSKRKYKPEFAEQIKRIQIRISQTKAKIKVASTPLHQERLLGLTRQLEALQRSGSVNRK